MSGSDQRNRSLVGKAGIAREITRLERERQRPLVAPALQFEPAVILPGRVPLGEHKSARLVKNRLQKDRLERDIEPVRCSELHERGVPEIGPR